VLFWKSEEQTGALAPSSSLETGSFIRTADMTRRRALGNTEFNQ